MPSRRRSASTSPRRVHAAACRTIRSFSAAVKDRRLPGFGSTSTATPLGRAAASGDAGAGVGWIDRRWDGLGTGQVQFSALCTQITRRRLSHSTLAQRVLEILLVRLHRAGKLDWSRAVIDSAQVPAKKGGAKTGPNPTDRGRSGSKHHLITDRKGTPLASPLLTASNVPDVVMLIPIVDHVSPIRGRTGRPRRRPDKLHADKGYASRANRRALRQRGIQPRIARKGIESSTHLGRHRWVVERSFAWLHRFRRLFPRYERQPEIHQGFLNLAAILICWSVLTN